MKKILYIFLILYACISLSGCSLAKNLLSKVPIFEDSDLDKLTSKAEKAWDEVGKETLKDAAEDAKDAIFGDTEELTWPKSKATEDIPEITSGKISDIYEKDSVIEIKIKEISNEGYNDYIEKLTSTFGEPNSPGIYKNNNRLISVVYKDDTNILILTISSLSQKTETSTNSQDT